MISKISKFFRHKQLRRLMLISLLCCAIIGLCISYRAAAILIVSYISGVVICLCFTECQFETQLYMKYLLDLCSPLQISTKKLDDVSCPVCNSDSCKRHNKCEKRFQNDIHVSNKLNSAIENFYNAILKNFISSWSNEISQDDLFLTELQSSLKYASESVMRRILNVDTSKIIVERIIPGVIKHFDDYLYMQQIAKLKNVEVTDVMVNYLGLNLHTAVRNRKNELKYLRNLISHVLPHVLPNDNLKNKNFFILIREIIVGCVLLPLMDAVSDPNMINELVILISTNKYKNRSSKLKSSECAFLYTFVEQNVKESKFICDLKSILKQTDLLYAFMQYLKREGQVNLLHFCLDIESFNNKLLTPDMSKIQLENLYTEAQNLYKLYFNPNSPNSINCPKSIATRFLLLLQEGVYNIGKLRTSEPLYQAYDYTFDVLEKTWLPMFFYSIDFYSHLCGSKSMTTNSKSSSKENRNKKYEISNPGAVTKISTSLEKIKGVLKSSQPIEGAIYPLEFQIFANEPVALVENIILSECEQGFRDLSSWKVVIQHMEMQQFGNSKFGNIFYMTIIIDSTNKNDSQQWIINRKEQDFYILRNKLIEFHGENEICDFILPTRKVMSATEANKIKYENFLNSLLQKPSLRGSDLLYIFLTSNEDFTLLLTTAVPIVEDLGNIYQSVAFKFRKERGQHLDSFLSTYLSSTGKSKQSKFEWAEMGEENEYISAISIMTVPSMYNNEIFGNNFNVSSESIPKTSEMACNSKTLAESLYYLLKHTFQIRQSIFKIYGSMYNISHQLISIITRIYVKRKLNKHITQDNTAELLSYIQDVIFNSKGKKLSENEKNMRKKEASDEIQRLLPHLIRIILGDKCVNGLINLFDILQNPLYNKQLMYNLLDIIVTEVCPELEDFEIELL